MGSRSKLFAAAAVAAAAAALFGACRADDTAGNSRADSATARTSAGSPPARPAPSAKPAPPVASEPPEEARRVTIAELKKMIDAGDAAVYDTRAKEAYEKEHIKGALSTPSNEVADHASEFPKDKTLVFYCT